MQDEHRSLAEVVTLVGDKVASKKDPSLPYIGLEHIDQGNARLLGWLPSNASKSVNSIFKRGDILFGKLRPNLKKSLPAPFDGYCSTDILVLRPKDGLDGRYIGFLFQQDGVFREAVRTAEGTKMPRASWRDLSIVPAFVPSYPEQQRIAEILDTIDTAIQRTEALIAKLKAAKAGLLHDLLTRGLDENGQLRDPERNPELFKRTELGWTPKAWAVMPLIKVATLKRGIDLPLQERKDGVVPVYGSNGVDGYHNTAPFDGPGVITGRSGSIGYVYYTDLPYWPLNTTLHVVNFHGNYPKFVAELLRFLRLERFAASTGVPSLNRNFVHPHLVACPPIEEQRFIVSVIDTHSKRIEHEEAYLSKLHQLKRGLMEDLLTGRVRVPLAQPEATQAEAVN